MDIHACDITSLIYISMMLHACVVMLQGFQAKLCQENICWSTASDTSYQPCLMIGPKLQSWKQSSNIRGSDVAARVYPQQARSLQLAFCSLLQSLPPSGVGTSLYNLITQYVFDSENACKASRAASLLPATASKMLLVSRLWHLLYAGRGISNAHFRTEGASRSALSSHELFEVTSR